MQESLVKGMTLHCKQNKDSAFFNYGVVRKFDAYGGPGCNDNDSLKYKL